MIQVYVTNIHLGNTSVGIDKLRDLVCINSSDIISPGFIKVNNKTYA